MSHKQSACVPPPSDYTPRSRPPNVNQRYREQPTNRGLGQHPRNYDGRRGPHQPTVFCRDQSDPEVPPKPPMISDRFDRNEDDDYLSRFEEDEEEVDERKDKVEPQADDDDDDPLDAYMKSLEDQKFQRKGLKQSPEQPQQQPQTSGLESQNKSCANQNSQDVDKRGVRLDIDETDDLEESYYKYVEQKKTTATSGEPDDYDESQNIIEYDKDGNIISVTRQKKEVEPLPPIDHSNINYEPFNRTFYQEHEQIRSLTLEQGQELRSKLEIKVSGNSPPKPVCSFAHFNFDEKLMRIIRRSEYTQPTPIQAQAIPAALSGRNVIGVAMTGSGKTAAYLWPMIVHIKGQTELKKGDGPIGLILVPTRELALQVYSEAKKFSTSYKMSLVCAYGGGSRYEQSIDLEAGAEIVVATPGRLIDLIKSGVTNLRRVTYLVLDEADRFFEMGFELQVRSICDQVRPDRQTLLFSATFKERIEQLARTVTDDPIRIVQKSIGEVNADVTQHVQVLVDVSNKWDWLVNRLVEFTSAGSVLIFVTRIVNSEELQKNLKEQGTEALLLHGDMEQSERNRVITCFKRRETNIMIATDVAARGLDISHIRTVINYDAARDIDTHIHRVGRTGRAGCKGDAYTLLTHKDKEFAGHLVKNLESSKQKVQDQLLKLAMHSHTFRKSRHQHKSRDQGHHHQHHGSSANHDRPRHLHDSQDSRDRSQHGHDSKPRGHGWQHSYHQRRSYESSTSYDRSRHQASSSDHDDDRKRPKWL